MNKSIFLEIGKWLLIALFTAINFFFYQVNGTSINLIVLLLIILYSIYEYYQLISKFKVNKTVKIPLSVTYSFALVSLLFCVQNLIIANYEGLIKNLIQILLYIGLSIYLIRKFSMKE